MLIDPEAAIRQFLEANEDYCFYLVEHLESKLFIENARKSFDSFCTNLYSDFQSVENLWTVNREKIRSCVSSIHAYNSIDWDSVRYWENIPLIDKESLLLAPEKYLNKSLRLDQLWLRPTSGTSGPPISVWYSPEFYFEFQYYDVCKLAAVGGHFDLRLRESNVFCVSLIDNRYLPNRVWVSPDGFRGLTIRPIYDERASNISIDRLKYLLDAYEPAILTLKPNVLESLLRNQTGSLSQSLRKLRLIISSGAVLDSQLRDYCEHEFDTTVLNAYGLSEFGGVASECKLRYGLHLYEHTVIAEVLGDDGALCETGRGELVLSSVENLAMPLIRFRTGDIVQLISSPCPCGIGGRRIMQLEGRRVLNFRRPDKGDFSPTNCLRLFDLFSIQEFQMIQTAVDKITVKVELRPDCDNQGTLDQIKAYLDEESGYNFQFDVLSCSIDTNRGFQRFISRL
jgi:phenylacetate-CoA ligase